MDTFIHLIDLIRSRYLNFQPNKPKDFDMNSVAILCPVVDLINHSFTPNCKIEGIYLTHEADSFVVLRSLRDIYENEELTINYGNYSNLDLLMKFGFLVKENPFNQMEINLDFMGYLHHTEQLFSLKQQLFKSIKDFSLDKFIIYSSKINADLLAILRIYFISQADVTKNPEIQAYCYADFKKKISNENEKLICRFMVDTLKIELDKLVQSKMSSLSYDLIKLSASQKTPTKEIIDISTLDDLHLLSNLSLRYMLQYCIEEELILKKNIQFFQDKLKTEESLL